MAIISVHNNIISISGDLTLPAIPALWNQLKRQVKQIAAQKITIDLTDITRIDSAGVAFLNEVESFFSQQKRHVQRINLPPFVTEAIESFSAPESKEHAIPQAPGFFEIIGEQAIAAKEYIIFLLYLTSDIFFWSIIALFKRQGHRSGSIIQQSVIIGVNAFPIVALLSFLIGLILALQSAAQLRQFGANIYIADLIGIAMLREMGPIMTAIIVAGRSGSAIASEIATMVVTEEIDAMKTMALNPIRYVVVPKFHAISLTMPLLTVMSDFLGILGGFVIGITYLQLSAAAFFNELLSILILKDVATGIFKSFIFAWIIIVVACYFGLRVKGGAEGVGKVTTASVVMSIFFVIVADSILGLIFYFE